MKICRWTPVQIYAFCSNVVFVFGVYLLIFFPEAGQRPEASNLYRVNEACIIDGLCFFKTSELKASL